MADIEGGSNVSSSVNVASSNSSLINEFIQHLFCTSKGKIKWLGEFESL